MEKCSVDVRAWFSAIEKGKLSAIQRLLKNPEDIDISTSVTINDVEHHNVTGLVLASHVGNKDVVRWFLLNKANVNATTSLGWQAIHFAAKRGHVATVDMLFSNGAIPDSVTKNHETPIYFALQAHMWDTVRKLLQLGATLDDTNEQLFSHCVQRGLLSVEMLNKRKYSRHSQLLSKPELEPTTQHPTLFRDVSPPLQAAPLTSIDVTSQTLVSQVQYQCFGYDVEISQRKRDLVIRLPILPPTLHLKNPTKLVQLVKILTNTHASLPFRISAAKDALRLLPLLDCRSKLKQGKRGVVSSFQGCLEPYLRLLELSVCERNCSEELASVISELTGRLCVMNAAHPPNPADDSDSECAEQTSSKGESPAVIKMIYVSRLLRKLVSKASSKPCAQYRAGILAHLCRILDSEMCVSSTDCVNGNCDNPPSRIPLSAFEPLLNNLFQLTDALDQATNVSRLSHFIQLIGASFSRAAFNDIKAEKLKAEFAEKFTDLADILVAWCVDPSSYSRGVAVGIIYRNLCIGLGPWWLNFPRLENSAYSTRNHQAVYLLTAACNMLGRLLEDTDDCLEKATTEYRQVCSSVAQRRGGPPMKPPATSDVSQNINAANIFSSVLSNTCSGLKRHLLVEISPHARVGMPSEALCVWISRLFNVLRNLDLLVSINAGLKPTPTPRAHVLSSYSLPLSTLPQLQRNAHNLLSFTMSTLECKDETLSAKASQHFLSYINRAADGVVQQVSPEHVPTLCELVHAILKSSSLESAAFGMETFKVLFGPESLLHKLKTSAVGSRLLLKLFLEITNSGALKASVILEMCLNDIELSAQKADRSESEVLLLFALTLFMKILPLGSESVIICFSERLVGAIADIFRRTRERDCPSDRVRMAIIYAITGIPLTRLSDGSVETVSFIIQTTLGVPSVCSDELEGIVHALLSKLSGHCLSKSKQVVQSTPGLEDFLDVSLAVVTKQPLSHSLLQSTYVAVFLQMLEKMIANAVGGFAASLPPALASHAFFKMNMMTCHQWFNRVRGPFACLNTWIHPLSSDCESSASTVWSIYSLLHQVIEFAQPGSAQWLNQLSKFGDPEGLLLCLVLSLYQVGASEELNLLHCFLQNSTFSGKHVQNPFSWVRGLACLNAGQLDQAITSFSTFVDTAFGSAWADQQRRSLLATYPDFGLASRNFALRLLLVLLIRVGDLKRVAHYSELVRETSTKDEVVCTNRGDSVGDKFQRPTDVVTESRVLPICFPEADADIERLRALQVMSKWDICLTEASPSKSEQPSSGIDHLSHLENKILLDSKNQHTLDSEALENLVNTVRQTSVSLAIQTTQSIGFGTFIETPLSDILVRANLCNSADERNFQFPQHSNTVGLATWQTLAGNCSDWESRTRSVLSACESMVFLPPTRQGTVDQPVDGSRGVAMRMLLDEFAALRLISRPVIRVTDYLSVVSSVNEKTQLPSIDRLRMIRCLGNLLWVKESPEEGDAESNHLLDKAVAMNCLAQGLRRSVVEAIPDRIKHADHCLMNASVALQLFNFLEGLMTSCGTENKSRTFCEAIYNCASHAVAEVPSKCLQCPNQLQSQAVSLVRHLLFFSELAAAPWVDGLPLVPPGREEESNLPQVTREVFATSSPSGLSMRLLMFATRLSPTNASAAAWLQMANWCFTRGQNGVVSVKSTAKQVLAKLLEPKGMEMVDTVAVDTLSSGLLDEENDALESMLERQLPDVTSDKRTSTRIRLLSSLYLFLRPKEDLLGTDVDGFAFSINRFCPDDLTLSCGLSTTPLKQKFAEHLVDTVPELFPSTSSADNQCLSLCRSIVSSLTGRLYTLHTFAAQAYVTYLTVAGQVINNMSSGGGTCELATTATSSAMPTESIAPIEPVTATLRLLYLLNEPCRSLRTLLKNLLVHGSDSQEPLRGEVAFQSAALSSQSGPVVWASCLPHLLVRLGHPDPAVRQCLLDLLRRLIEMTSSGPATLVAISKTDHALVTRLVFPAIVSSQGVDAATQSDYRTKSHAEIVSALRSMGCSEMVDQVLAFVVEARRLAILWEELWCGALTQHLDELAKKTNILAAELRPSPTPPDQLAAQTSDLGVLNPEGSCQDPKAHTTPFNHLLVQKAENLPDVDKALKIRKLRYRALLAPTLTVFNQLCALTLSEAPETSHEAWFQATFRTVIDETVNALNQLCESPDPQSPAMLLQALVSRFQTLSQPVAGRLNPGGIGNAHAGLNAPCAYQPTNPRVLNLSHVSPRLANLSEGLVRVPAGNKQSSGLSIPLPGRSYLNLARVGLRINVYPTKTRPKRIIFWGENGCAYPYLLKCLEDLRLDDRVIQLMRLTNIAVRSRVGGVRSTTLRTYSVTPIGPKAGLIQMVQGAMPLFSLYKRWQQRRAADALDGDPSKPLIIPKPSDLFYSRLKELMPPDALINSASRPSWPLPVLRKVLKTLEAETAPDLLTRELWAASPSMSSWWNVSSTFAQSLGSTSAFGYLLGLGDRHLDNLLVDLTTGRLVHIDFNICFDEGRNLRVPELVPFRLTRILRHPLGPLAFHLLSSLHDEHEASEKQQQRQNLVSMGAFGHTFRLTLETFRQISELIMIQLHSFAFDPLTDWMRSRQSECNFDLSYLSAYRGGCTKVVTKAGSDSASSHDLPKRQRLRQRILVELQRNAGLLAARFIELSESTIWKNVCGNLYDTFARLEDNLILWKEYKDTESETRQLGAVLEELESKSAANRLASFERRVRLDEEVGAALVHTTDRLSTFVSNLRDSVSSHRSVLSRWMTPANGIFKLPASVRCEELVTLLTAYRSVARAYLVPPDSNLQVTSNAWFNKSTFSIHVLSKILQRTDLNTIGNLEDVYLSAMSESSVEEPAFKTKAVLEDLTSAIALTAANTETLKMQNLALDETELDLEAIFAQEEENLRLFLREQGIFGPAAYKWALTKRVSEWVKSLAGMEAPHKQEPEASFLSAHRLDQIYQHLVVLTAAFSVFDSTQTEYSPSLGEFCAVPFNAGLEADAQAELIFLFSANEFVKCLVDLRDNIFELLLPELEDALIDAPSEGGLIDQLARILLQHGEVDSTSLQAQVADLLMRSSPTRSKNDEHLAQVFLAVHLTLTNASAQMSEISRRMSECPITAPAWFYVDYVSQAVGTLQSRCVNGLGATSLWGWRSISGEPVRDSWTDEVYISGLAAIVNLCESLRCHWSTVRCGIVKTDNLDESTGQADRIDWEQRPVRLLELFLGRLINRLALISQATLAASRLLLSLLEESGMSVRNALIEIDRLNSGPDLQHSLLAIDRLVQSAEFCAMSMQPPRVRALAGVAGSLLTNLFTRAARYVNKTSALRSVFYAEEHVRRLSLYRTVFVWIHGPSFPESELRALEQEETVIHPVHGKETSCPVCLSICLEKISEAVATARSREAAPDWTEEETEVIEEICTLGEAICAAESERIQTQISQTEVIALLKERDSMWQKQKDCESELTDMDFKLLALKDEYNLDWPASKWLSKTVNAVGQPPHSYLLDCLSSALDALEAKCQDSRSRLLSVSSALSVEDRQKTVPGPTDGGGAIGGTSAPARTKNRGKTNRKSSSIASNHDLVSSVTTLRQALATFQRSFLLELRPYVKFALRMEQSLSSEGSVQAPETATTPTTTKSSVIWASWLEKQQVWTSTSMRLLKNLTRFVTDLSNFPESACFEERTFSLAAELVTDCRELRRHLTPYLLSQLKSAVLISMSLSEECTNEKFAECFAELDFCEEKEINNADDGNDSTDSVNAIAAMIGKVSSPEETVPSAVIAALKRLYDRLRGRDSLLFVKQSPSRTAVTAASSSPVPASPSPPSLGPSEQTEACIYAAVDPDRLAPMFEGWTAWV
ncbi:hypothetical protein AAHC03_013418 [Spirometra sp. Aus1]